jgi:predicted aspartyl protease
LKTGVRFGDQIIYIEMTDPMGRTEVRATVIGEKETREYTFLVDTGATYLALPIEKSRPSVCHRGLENYVS